MLRRQYLVTISVRGCELSSGRLTLLDGNLAVRVGQGADKVDLRKVCAEALNSREATDVCLTIAECAATSQFLIPKSRYSCRMRFYR